MDIKKSITLEHSRERVWQALTHSDALGAWLMPNDFKLELGHAFTFRADPAPGFDGIVQCEVLSFEDGLSLSYAWRNGGLDTVVTYELEALGPTTTRLLLKQTGFGFADILPRLILGPGWSRLLKRKLPAYLEPDQPSMNLTKAA